MDEAKKGEGGRGKGDSRMASTADCRLPTADSRPFSLAIIGGGLAGLAAAVAARERGLRVELFEQANGLGGRAGSLVDAATGDRIDYCQHVAMACCARFLDFCRRTGIDDCFERSATLHFIGPDGRQYDFTASRWLPAPLCLLPGLLKLPYLSLGERWGIAGALRKLVRERDVSPLPLGEGPGVRAEGLRGPHPNPLPKGEGTIGEWLRRHGQSDRAIERFWSVVLVSALGETVDHASLSAARKVFRDGFLASRRASELVLPRRPLGAIFHDRLGKWLAEEGVEVHLGTPVRRVEGRQGRAGAVALADGTRREFDSVIVAVPWRNVKSLFTEDLLAAMPALANVERIEPAAITAVHLWFDRPIAPLAHAVLIGRLSQWVFVDTGPANHCQVVISGSHRLPERTHDALLAEVRGELESVWPAAHEARFLHGRVIIWPAAVFSVTPGVDRFRPPQQTPIENLALAGDWTATGWPATMEGAVRSGFRAVEALHNQRGPIANVKLQI
jgi:protoporphyrinogen oxidase